MALPLIVTDVDTFRVNFPVFNSVTLYPAAQIQFWIDLSTLMLNANRWGDVFEYGRQLFIAHNLALDANSGGAGGGIGQIIGPVTSASVDKVSYSRDVQAAMLDDAGHWNLTVYGIRYIQMLRMMGAGPIQVGVDPLVMPPYSYSGPAWPGFPYNYW